MAVKVTEVPEQMVVAVEDIETPTGELAFTVIFTGVAFTVVGDAQVALETIVKETTSLLLGT